MENKRSNRIAELLTSAGITQKKLSELTGITESSISHYMKGDRIPRGVNLLKIAREFNVTTDYVLGVENVFNEEDFNSTKTLIARSATKMTDEQKMELMRILMENK